MCRDRGSSSSTTLLTSGGTTSSAASRYIFITYSEDWTNWVGAEEICRNQGYPLVTIDSDSKPIIESMMQAAGVNQICAFGRFSNPVRRNPLATCRPPRAIQSPAPPCRREALREAPRQAPREVLGRRKEAPREVARR